MPLDNIKIEIGKTYSIDYILGELEKAPDVQLGHITIFDPNVGVVSHMYHIDKKKLEDLKKEIDKKVREGKAEYEKKGKKYIGIYDVTVLSITDPFAKYEYYAKFYGELYKDVEEKIDVSKKGSVAAPTEAIISEARKAEFIITKEEEFLKGLSLFFKRRGIETGTISGGKYITFEKKGFRPRPIPRIIASESEYEKYKIYTKLYEDIFKQITEGMAARKGEVATPMRSILDESRKLGFDIEGKEKDLIRGMEIYFNTRNIATEITEDGIHMIFRRP